jgi:RNA polymerase sigma-70 factor (ECF subfamily)
MTDPSERLEAAFHAHCRDVMGYCLRRCPTPEDAEEAATEVFATAWRRIGALPGEPEARLWLFGVARRVVANQLGAARLAAALAPAVSSSPGDSPPGRFSTATQARRAQRRR